MQVRAINEEGPGPWSDPGTGSIAANQPPVFVEASPTRAINENISAGQFVGAPVTATDGDSDTLVYTLGGTDGTSFTIDANTGQISTVQAGVPYDFETKSIYTVTVTVNDGTVSVNKDVTITLINAQEAATGEPTIDDTTPLVGQTLTADPSGIDDPDGLTSPTYTWQWIRVASGGTETDVGTNSNQYTVAVADRGNTLKVSATFTDDANHPQETRTSAATSPVQQKLEATQGFTAVAGDGKVTFSWTVATNTNANGYIITQHVSGGNDIARQVNGRSTATYTWDSLNNGTSYTFSIQTRAPATGDWVDSDASAQQTATPVANTLATGAPAITGELLVGQQLTADPGNIADATDGLTSPTYAWQWIVVDGGTETDIDGAESITYTLVVGDHGKTLKVRATFKDDKGNDESRTSDATEVVKVKLAAPDLTLNASSGQIEVSWDAVQNADGYVIEWSTNNFTSTLGAHTISTGSGGSYDILSLTNGTDYSVRMRATALSTSTYVDSDNSAPQPATPTDSSVADLRSLEISGVPDATLGFASGTVQYTVVVALSVSSVTVTPTVEDANATVTVNGVSVNNGEPSDSLDLIEGNNTITIVVTAEDRSSRKTYTVTVRRLGPWILSLVRNGQPFTSVAETDANVDYPSTTLRLERGSSTTVIADGFSLPVSINGTALNPDDYVFNNPFETINFRSTFGDVRGSRQITIVGDDLDEDEIPETIIFSVTFEGTYSVTLEIVDDDTNSTAGGAPTINDTTPLVGQTLTASTDGISDADGKPTDAAAYTYQWIRVVNGSEVNVGTDSNLYTVAPDDRGNTLMVRVTFNDVAGNPESVTSAETSAVKQAPTADAGQNQEVETGETVTLDGSGSSDPDGDTLTYSWTQTAGPPVTLNDSDTATPTFTPASAATLVFQLIVNDGDANSEPDTVTIDVTLANRAPTANAGPDQNVETGAPVTLDGRGSSDPDGDTLTYSWTQTSGPSVTLSSTTTVSPTFAAPDEAATLVFSLTVSDGTVNSAPDTVIIGVALANLPPTANAGQDQDVETGATVTLDGSGSTDPDDDPLTYAWAQTAGPTVELSDPTAESPTFTAPDEAATLVFSLTVNDGTVNSAPDTVTIGVEPANVAPTANAGTDQAAETGETVTLDGSGSSDPDGDPLTYAWTQTAGPTVTLSSATVAMPTFTAPDEAATLVFSLTVNDGEVDSEPDTVTIDIALANRAPTANAGQDQNVETGEIVTLDGSGSSDPDGDALTYAWTQTAGPPVTLSSTTVANPSFTTPGIAATLVFSLTVNDGTVNSAPDTVTIDVALANRAPTANAGPDQNVETGATVTLDGSGSTDPDGDPLTYTWTQTSGPPVALSDATAESPTFTAPTSATTLEFSLTVNDGEVDSAPDTVIIGVALSNLAPTANAGPDQNVETGATVTLDGSGSTDPDGDPLTYTWTQTSGPPVTLSSATIAMPSFTAPASATTLVFSLTVNDGTVNSAPDTVTITVAPVAPTNRAPTANAGPDRTVNTGDTVTLNGNGSSDPDGDALTYAWTQTSGPTVTLSGATTATPSFTAPASTTTLVFSLTVNDGTVNSAPDTVTITVTETPVTPTNTAPTANAGPDRTVSTGATVTLDGSGSSDPDGDTLTYAWTQTAGPTVTLSDTTIANPTFTAPDSAATLVFSLTVSDGSLSASDTVTVTVAPVAPTNRAPTANAGPDRTVNTGATVTLDGSGSSDPDGDALTYSWTQTSGTTVTLSDTAIANPTFTAPNSATTLVFSLTVSDGSLSDTDTVTITVTAAPVTPTLPRISIRAVDSSVTEGETIRFTIEADTAPSAALPVSVRVVGVERFGVETGNHTATIAADATSTTLTLRTENDRRDESDGTVVAVLRDGANYSLGTPSRATVTVRDDDAPSTGSGSSRRRAPRRTPTPLPTAPVTTIAETDGGVTLSAEGSARVTVNFSLGGTALLVTVSVDQKSAGTQLTLHADEALEELAIVEMRTVTDNVVLDTEPPSGFRIAGSEKIVDITLRNKRGNRITELTNAATVCLPVSADLLEEAGDDPVALLHYDPEEGWTALLSEVREESDGSSSVCAETTRFSPYAIGYGVQATPTPEPEVTPEPEATEEPEETPTPRPTATPRPAATATPEPAPTATPVWPTPAPDPTATPVPEATATATARPAATATPRPAPTATSVMSAAAPTATPAPSTATPVPAPTAMPEPTATPAPVAAAAAPDPTATPAPAAPEAPAADGGGVGVWVLLLLVALAVIVIAVVVIIVRRRA